MRTLSILALLAGCGDPPDDTDVEQDTGVVDWTILSDTDLAAALIAGEVPERRAALLQLAWSDGLPVRTESGFLVIAEGAGPYSLQGDHNGWSPEPMTASDGLWWAEVSVSDPAGSRYQIVDDSGPIRDRWARSYDWEDRGQVSYLAAPAAAHLERWPDLEGQGLLPRDLLVHVPAGSGPWPTLYVHDGQNLFDPNAFWGGWHLQDTLRAESTAVLVVGIASTGSRIDEYTHTPDVIDDVTLGGDAPAYAALLRDDVRPAIEARYATTSKAGLLGSSLGGLVSVYVALQQPDAWDFAGSMSGTMGWGRFGASNATVEELYLAADVPPFVVFLDSGGTDGGDGCDDLDLDGLPEDDPNDADNYCTNRHMADQLAGHGFTWQTNLFHWHEPGAQHNEAAWAARVFRPIEIFEGL